MSIDIPYSNFYALDVYFFSFKSEKFFNNTHVPFDGVFYLLDAWHSVINQPLFFGEYTI